MNRPRIGWNDEYYEALEFFYWEPQHLGKIKNPRSSYGSKEAVLKHLRVLEVTLNHQLRTFFRLLPAAGIAQIFSRAFSVEIDDDFFLYSPSLLETALETKDSTQPDLFFAGSTSIVGVELKLSAKSNLGQVTKYAFLDVLQSERTGARDRSFLLFIAPGEFSDLWKESFADPDALKSALAGHPLQDTTGKGGIDLRPYHSDIRATLDRMHVGFLSYSELSAALQAIGASLGGTTPAHETLQRLIDGMTGELRARGLAGVKPSA